MSRCIRPHYKNTMVCLQMVRLLVYIYFGLKLLLSAQTTDIEFKIFY